MHVLQHPMCLGVCTAALLSVVNATSQQKLTADVSWLETLSKMRVKLVQDGYAQIPQLSSSRLIELSLLWSNLSSLVTFACFILVVMESSCVVKRILRVGMKLFYLLTLPLLVKYVTLSYSTRSFVRYLETFTRLVFLILATVAQC